MNHQRISSFTILICISMIFSSTPSVYGQRTTFSDYKLKDLENNATRTTYKISEQGNRYLSYLYGPIIEYSEPDGNSIEGEHVFKFADISLTENDDGSINVGQVEVIAENVTNKLVFPYHYNFQIDSNGNIHTAFISNYTLFYAVRTNGLWQETQLSNVSRWWGLQPDIALGENDHPRIVYTVIYKTYADDFFGTQPMIGARSLHYILFDGTDVNDPTHWLEYDIKDNHGPFSRGPSKMLIYNPGIIIENGKALIAFNEVKSLAVRSRMDFMSIPEIPTILAENNTFSEFTFTEIYSARIIATRFRRPSIFLIDQSVIIAYSSWETGGVVVSMLEDVDEMPNPDLVYQPLQWYNRELDMERRNLEVESISGVFDSVTNELILTWSVFDLFNEGEGLFDFDIFSTTILIDDIEFTQDEVSRITDSINIEHWYPSMVLNNQGDLEIMYIIHEEGESAPYQLAISINRYEGLYTATTTLPKTTTTNSTSSNTSAKLDVSFYFEFSIIGIFIISTLIKKKKLLKISH